jgi:long-chain acyl-CoA synthetase
MRSQKLKNPEETMLDSPWLKSYPKGVRWDAEIVPTRVEQILDDTVAKWPSNPAIDFMGKRLSYAELGAVVDRCAAGLRKLGVKKGVHVGLYLPNTPHCVIGLFGILKAGGTVVNYSPLDAGRVLEHKVEDSETDFIITVDLAVLYPQMKELLGKTRLKKLIVGNLAEMSGAPDAVRAGLAGAKQLADIPIDGQHLTFAQLLDNDGKYEPEPAGDLARSIALLQYTGGTTGLPKGAMLTHANLTSACGQYWATANGEPPLIEPGKERMLIVLPLFHIYALTANMLFGISIGAELVLHARFELDKVLADLTAKKISVFLGVPTMFMGIMAAPGIDKIDLTSLKYCASGGAPLPVETITEFKRLTGCDISEGWGMTETSPAGTFTPIGEGVLRKPGSCGVPSPNITIKFLDVGDPSKTVALGEPGEIAIKGPNVMLGYWKNDAATAENMTPDGFMRTGDVAYMDADGFIFIVDRTKDMLLCGGYNVYPRNIEEAIYEHSSVAEVCVIGIPDQYRGQSPKAYLALKPGAPELSLKELKDFLKSRLGKHEMISEMETRAALPRTPVGKLSKKELYDEINAKTAAAKAAP